MGEGEEAAEEARVDRTVRLRRHRTVTVQPRAASLKRREALRQLPVVRQWRTAAAPLVVEWQLRRNGLRMTHPTHRGSPMAAPDTLGTITFHTPLDGQWEPGRARRAGR